MPQVTVDWHEVLLKAIKLALRAHGRQLDKCGDLYILHPLAVMSRMESDLDRTVAVMHDLLEDTYVTVEVLRDFPEVVVNAVLALTRRKDKHLLSEAYTEYLARVRANPIALRVKLQDIAHNTSPVRLARLPEAEQVRLKAKYTEALAFLARP